MLFSTEPKGFPEFETPGGRPTRRIVKVDEPNYPRKPRLRPGATTALRGRLQEYDAFIAELHKGCGLA